MATCASTPCRTKNNAAGRPSRSSRSSTAVSNRRTRARGSPWSPNRPARGRRSDPKGEPWDHGSPFFMPGSVERSNGDCMRRSDVDALSRLEALHSVSNRVKLAQPLERQLGLRQLLEPRHRVRCPTLPHRFLRLMHSAQKANLRREAFWISTIQ